MLNSDLSARLKGLLMVDPSSSEIQKNDDAGLAALPMRGEKPIKTSVNNNDKEGSTSLVEQMMAASASAKKSQKQKQRDKEQKRANNATFGMKKGFLTKDKPAKDTRSSITQTQRNLIVEVTSEGKTTTPGYSSQEKKAMPSQSIGTCTSSNNQSSSTSISNPLYLPEVQDALSSHLQSAQPKWTSPTFINSLSKHPTLSKGWNDPRYMAALESIKTHPKETMEKLKADEPEILHWLMEFMSVVGDHFAMLGSGANDATEEDEVKVLEEPTLLREMGPLEEKARKALKAQPNVQEQLENNSMEDDVKNILSNDSLRSILLDPKMQQIMDECASGDSARKLQWYMRHDDFGPKLRVLMKAGLLELA